MTNLWRQKIDEGEQTQAQGGPIQECVIEVYDSLHIGGQVMYLNVNRVLVFCK